MPEREAVEIESPATPANGRTRKQAKATKPPKEKKGRKGRRNARIKDVADLGAAATAAPVSDTTAPPVKVSPASQNTSIFDDSETQDDPAAAMVADVLNSGEPASGQAEAGEQAADPTGVAGSDVSSTDGTEQDTVDEPALSAGFASSVLQPGPLLDIADASDMSDDDLDLAEFVIQAAVSGDEDDDQAPISLDSVDGKQKAVTLLEEKDQTGGDKNSKTVSASASAEDARQTADQSVETIEAENPLLAFGFDDAVDAETGPDEKAGSEAKAKSGDTPFDRNIDDSRYVSPDLRIPMIDEDDIPTVEAAYEYDEAEQQSAAAAASTGQSIVESSHQTADAARETAPDPSEAMNRQEDAPALPPARTAEEVASLNSEEGEAPARQEATIQAEETAKTASAHYPTAFARRETEAPATPDNAGQPAAGYTPVASSTEEKGEGARDVDAGRLFSALSLKRLAIPPHVFEARQRVNIISGLAIIGALGFVGWYFSNPGPLQETRLVEAEKPKTTDIASRAATDAVRAAPTISSGGPKVGLIYKPMKKVKLAALTAIGDLEYKITPSKFHRMVKVIKGDTFVSVLVRAGVDSREAGRAIQSMRSIYDPRKLRIGREIRVAFGVAGAEQTRFMGYNFDSSFDRSIHVARQQSGEFAAAEVKKKISETYSRVDGKITSSLFGSGMRSGAPAQTMVQMIHLFSFAVDFQRDLRGGETFKILFRSHKDDTGRVVRSGEILFASLTVRGKTHNLYFYQNTKSGKTEYLNEKGQGNRKALMKTPIDGARLTSNFGYRRHPILGYSKLHTGADFGARTGTPIYAAGDGTITKIGWFGGYGKYIRIRHGKVYQTAYAHMSRFRPGLRVGARVKQGETIGYVGSTGRSTGPHLHYEVLKNGKHVNPMTITLPSRKRLQGRAYRRFMAFKKKIDERFAGMKNEREKRQEGRIQTVKSEGGDSGCKNGIRINPLDKRPCN